MADQDLGKQIADQLGRIFRHMLPGLSIICLAAASHPSWFESRFTASPWTLAVFTAIAVLAGNTWYVFHRYSLHQFIDWIIYRCKRKSKGDYTGWLADHIYKSFQLKKRNRELHEHISFRSAQIIFIFITSEIALLFSWHAQTGTFYQRHAPQIAGVALFGVAVGIVQYVISHDLDVSSVERSVDANPTH